VCTAGEEEHAAPNLFVSAAVISVKLRGEKKGRIGLLRCGVAKQRLKNEGRFADAMYSFCFCLSSVSSVSVLCRGGIESRITELLRVEVLNVIVSLVDSDFEEEDIILFALLDMFDVQDLAAMKLFGVRDP